MRKPTLINRLLLGLLLGIFLTPNQPAQAQWTVFDPTSYAAQIEEMARLIPNGRLKVFQDASHFALWQDPESFNATLS